MNPRVEPNLESPCPFAESVRALWSGELDDSLASDVEQHLADCPSCGALVDTLVEPSDGIIQSLSSLPPSADDELEYRLLAERLLGTTGSHEGGSSGFVPLRLANPPLGPLPQTLGNYELLACVGRGAWGAVYRARHTKLDQITAVKVLDTSRLRSTHAVERFLQEMKAAGQLHHPNIVRATDAGEDRSFHYLVMEFVDGIDAGKLLQRRGPLAVAEACEIVRQAAAALAFAHGRAWVHRDVKPSNLMLSRDGVVKLLDLGVAGRHALEDSTEVAEDTASADKADPPRQLPLGTADYMAPEQWTHFAAVDARADVFSLGCTLYRLLAGNVPFEGGVKLAASDASAWRMPTPLDERADVPRGLARFVERMLTRRPEDRVSSAAEVERELARWVRKADLPVLVAAACGDEAPPRSKLASWTSLLSRRQMIAGSIAACGAALLLTWAITPPTPELRRNEWRELAPAAPDMLLAVDPNAQVTYGSQKPPQITVNSRELALVHMGRSVSGTFSLEVVLRQHNPIGSAGIFFQGRYLEGRPNVYEFQSIELLPPAERGDSATGRLVWSRWELVDENGQLAAQREPWAETTIPLRGTDGQKLQVTLGRRDIPEVAWNGHVLAESSWRFSDIGRERSVQLSGGVRQQNLGRLGLVNSGGSTVFLLPRLAYR